MNTLRILGNERMIRVIRVILIFCVAMVREQAEGELEIEKLEVRLPEPRGLAGIRTHPLRLASMNALRNL